MALSYWGGPINEIDLTNDSDDDYPPVEPPQPKRTPVPLPENVRDRYSSASRSLSNAPSRSPAGLPIPSVPLKKTLVPIPAKQPLNGSSSSYKSVTPSSVLSPTISPYTATSSENGVRQSYVPVFSGVTRENGDGFGLRQQPEKRRKLSSSGNRKSNTNGHYETVDKGASEIHQMTTTMGQGKSSRGSFSNGSAGQKSPTRDRAPTVHSLNSALKVSGTRMAVSSELLASKARPLHIGRMAEDHQRDVVIPNAAASSSGNFSNMQRSASRPLLGGTDLGNFEWNQHNNGTLVSFATPTSPTGSLERTVAPSKLTSAPIKSPVQDEDSDSVISKSSHEDVNTSTTTEYTTSVTGKPADNNPTTKAQAANVKKFTNRFTTEEDHLLIYLKEHQKLKWAEICKHFPNRSYGVIQTRYSHTLNKRNRSQDPPTLSLPPGYATGITLASVPHPFPSESGVAPISNPFPTAATSSVPHRRRGRPRREEQKIMNSLLIEQSSGNESAPHRGPGRSRRNVQAVDYTWPRRRGNTLGSEDLEDEHFDLREHHDISLPLQTYQSSKERSVGPDAPLPINTPMHVDFGWEDASLVTSGGKRPYLSFAQRSIVRDGSTKGEWGQLEGRNWQGSIFHVDFNHEEMDVAEAALKKVLRPAQMPPRSSRRRRFHGALKDQPDSILVKLSYEIRRKLHTRNRGDVDAFLHDAKNGKLHSGSPRIARLGMVKPNQAFQSVPKTSTPTLVRQRELGLQSRRGWKSASRTLTYQLKNNMFDSLGPAYSFTEGPHDMHTVAWSPDGQCFAAGAVCLMDPDSMQYNRPNNLVYGDIARKTICELAEHHIEREEVRPETGPNSTHAMAATQDRKLYTTVTNVAFSPDGEHMFSTGWDNLAIIWGTARDGSQPEFMQALKHKAKVDLLAVSREGVLATGTRRYKNAIKVIPTHNVENYIPTTFSSRKSDERPDQNILPTALQFEPTRGRLLLAGFGANKREDRLDMNGDICLWDVEHEKELYVHGSTRNVFDVAFIPNQPEQPLFAVGCVAGANVNRHTRSTVRIYDGRGGKPKSTNKLELECPALDMNDVQFCPYNDYFVAAGCTDGRTYIWDVRRPDEWVYKLSHGKSLMPLDDFQDREVTDTGVRFLSWGESATRLYTGSSDGVVKVWDVTYAHEDVFIKDLITVDSGVMSGAFSPDYSRLIIGEVNGSVNVLETGRDDCSIKDMERLKYIPYEEGNDDVISEAAAPTAETDSGRAIASELLATGEIVTVPCGGLPIRQAVQGPNYAGPFDDTSVDAPFLREQALQFQYSLAKTPGLQCSIPSCKDNIVKLTNEEAGDSGRSADRIPDEIRKQWTMINKNDAIIPGKSSCTHCGRPARPSDSEADLGQTIACERCSFACFRCGSMNKISPAMKSLICRTCLRVWDIGVLGYECVEETGCGLRHKTIPSLKRFGTELTEASNNFLEINVSYGDEMNALTDYYLSLAIDRPESPPL